MKSRLYAAAAALCLLISAPAFAQTVAPRPVVEEAAAAIEAHYWSEELGTQIATDLRRANEAGEFDRYTDPRDLAAALTARLQPRDAHFSVQWSAEEQAAQAGPQPEGPPQGQPNRAELDAAAARGAYGFTRVEMLPGGVGYIDLRAFANFSPDDAETSPARRAADAAMSLLAGASAIIIDERDCPGGSPAMVGYLSAYFTAPGADIFNTFRSRRGERSERNFVDPRGERRLDTPLFIVTSGRTGSACEAFAYTLGSADRATIVGQRSGGAANPGGEGPLRDGFSMFISGGSPVNPITGRNWEGDGVPVDVEVASHDALRRARVLALEAILAGAPSANAAREAQWALDAVNAEGATLPARTLRQYAGDYGARRIALENDRLVLYRDRRPGLTLTPLGDDLFAVDGAAPLQRVRFERDSRGRVIALTQSLVTGQEFRNLKL